MTSTNPAIHDSPVHEAEKKIEAIATKLEVKLPKGFLPLPMRILALIFIVGGLSILGSVFTDFVIPKSDSFGLHIYRLVAGLTFLAVAYGLYDRKRWSLWLYGAVVFIGLFVNFTVALIPAMLVVYLYIKRRSLKPCALDAVVDRMINRTP